MKLLHRIACFAAAAAVTGAAFAQSSTNTNRSSNQSSQDRRSSNATSNDQSNARGSHANSSDTSAENSRARRTGGDVGGATKLSRADRGFLEKAAKSGMKEVLVSEAVMPHLTQQQTKQFAQMMVRDHTQNNQELMALAQSKGVELPKKDDRLARKWSGKSEGADDRYMKEMVADHKKTIELFEKGARSEDPDIAAFAQKTLPKLQQHLQMAQGHRMEH